MRGLIFLGGAIAIAAFVITKARSRSKPKSKLAQLRGNAEDAFGDVESRVEDLRDRAKRLGGDARKRLQDQAHELESRQREIRHRLDELRAEAQDLVKKTRAAASSG